MSGWGPAVAAVLRRPSLWWVALTTMVSLAPRGWWRRAPFLPLPDREWMRFRMVTAYGSPDHPPEPDDLVAFLRWRQGMVAGSRR